MIDKLHLTQISVHEMKIGLSVRIGPIKDRLRRRYYPDNDTVTSAEKKWAVSTGINFYERSMQALVDQWQTILYDWWKISVL